MSDFAYIDHTEFDIDHYDINVYDGEVSVNAMDVDVTSVELGDIYDNDSFLDYCRSQGFNVTEDGDEIVIKTNWKRDENGNAVEK